MPGYHTVSFSTQPIRPAGVRFYVIVRLTTPGSDWPIPLEDAEAGYSSKATTAAGESFVSADGTAGSWRDVAKLLDVTRGDVCLKVFAGAATPDPTRPVTKALAAAR